MHTTSPSVPSLVASAVVALLTAPASAQKWLDAAREIHPLMGDNIRSFADFNGDGLLDLVTRREPPAAPGVGEFWLSFGAADGSFVPGPSIPVLSAGFEGEDYVLAGDVTGDGLPDVISSFRNPGSTPPSGILLYRNLGGGVLATPILTVAEVPGGSGALTDWNGDGQRELVALHLTPTLGIELRRWTWNGSQFVSSNPAAMPDYVNELSVGDVTSDGLTDTVIGCVVDNRVFVVPTLAGGGLGPVTTLTVGPATTSVQGRVPSCGDVDGDGDQDIVVAWTEYQVASHIAVVTNQGAQGLSAGQPSAFAIHPGSNWTGRVYVTDWDNDGDGDVLLGHEQLWLLENVAGTLTARSSRRMARSSSGFNTDGHSGAGIADFDGDGRPDFAGGRALVYGDGRFDSRSFGIDSSGTQAIDDDADGDLDLLASGNQRLDNQGRGNFVSATAGLPTPAPSTAYFDSHAIGDFTGDGRIDRITPWFQVQFPFVSLLGTRLLAGAADGRLVDVGFAGTPATSIGDPASFAVRQVDLDADGDVDLAATGGWWENGGNGVFSTFRPAWTGTPLELADVNGDGRPDVLTRAGTTAVEHRIFVSQPGGGYAGQLLVSDGASAANGVLADLDGDGDLDCAVGLTSGPTVSIHLNTGGAFAVSAPLPSRELAYERLLVDDFDGDGNADLAAGPASVTGYFGAPILVWRQAGPGPTFAAPRAYFSDAPLVGRADLDGDGDADFYGTYGLVANGRIGKPQSGSFAQYGNSEAGPSGVPPRLGVRGPVRSPGQIELRFRRAPGASIATLGFGVAATELPNVPFPGLTLRVVPDVLLLLPLGGSATEPGSGFADLPIVLPPGLSGFRFFMQSLTLDGAGFGATNGLELEIGG